MCGVLYQRYNVLYIMSLLMALGVLIYLIYLELLFVSIHLKSLYFKEYIHGMDTYRYYSGFPFYAN
jgi:hypothetical protein